MTSFVPQFSQGPYSGIASPADSIHFPALFDYDAARDLISYSPENEPILGISGDGQPITVNLDSDSPHVLVSASTGAGKSAVLRALAAQMMRNGSVATFLDLKRHSHRWAKNLPNAGYAQTLPEIGNALVEIGQEVHRRNAIVEDWPGTVETAPVGPRIIVVFEELNATFDSLKQLSKRIPEGTYNALDAFGDIMFMGRAARVHVLAVAQFAEARAMGGSAIRENFTTRILIKYSKQAWTMLAWDCGLPIAAPEEPGRGMVCYGGKARKTQLLYLTEEEAAQLARSPFAVAQANSVPRIDA